MKFNTILFASDLADVGDIPAPKARKAIIALAAMGFGKVYACVPTGEALDGPGTLIGLLVTATHELSKN